MCHETLHIVFSPVTAGFVGGALRQVGRNDAVVFLLDSFEIGPINSSDPERRQIWCESQSGFDKWNWPRIDAHIFWQEALAPEYRRKIVWLLRRSSHDYAGFLEWLWRIGDAPCDVVDVSDVQLHYPGHGDYPILTLSGLTDDVILTAGLLESAVELLPEDRKEHRELWGRLRAEDAPLRPVTSEGFVSGPISYFDDMLLSHVSREWGSAEIPVIEATCHFVDLGLWQADMSFLAARVRALVLAGTIEARGDLSDERNCELRLAR